LPPGLYQMSFAGVVTVCIEGAVSTVNIPSIVVDTIPLQNVRAFANRLVKFINNELVPIVIRICEPAGIDPSAMITYCLSAVTASSNTSVTIKWVFGVSADDVSADAIIFITLTRI
ncbi:MAG: hypothetical protein MUC65_09750, partial [Pontiellaceae bacterium]|nr:hypothetical protein [Pontiellaceae bacterium]